MNAPGSRLNGRRIAILIEDGFSERQVVESAELLSNEGAEVVMVAPSLRAPYRGRMGTVEVSGTLAAGSARAGDFDALLLPGGQAPDRARMRHAMVDFVAEAMAIGKPVAAICHGPQLLITANVLRGRTLTCWPSIAVDVKNAGGLYVDRPSVRDGNLISARKSADLPAFIETLILAVVEAPAAR